MRRDNLKEWEGKVSLSYFICPVCNCELSLNGKTYQCINHHCYDKAKSGYVNLFLSQAKKEKVHGDDKAMLLARRNFLDKGYYKPLLDKILDIIKRFQKNNGVILDAGCGEGWYTDHICQELKRQNLHATVIGIDISKSAVDLLAKRNKEIEAAVASAYNVPIISDSCDIILSVFAPFSAEEIHRILKRGAVFIRVYPLEKHLFSLKKLIYEDVILNRLTDEKLEGLELIESHTVKDMIHLESNSDILNLFMMTPYYYKTGKSDQEKISGIARLSTEIEFGIDVYQRL